MQNIWKITTVLLLIACLVMGYYLFLDKSSHQESGSMSLSEVSQSNFEEKKKKNPMFAPDNNDYFFKNPTTIEFLQNEYDFDTIPVNKVITKDIRFINTGKNPYFITDIKVSCGCTIPSYDNKPIAAGDTGRVQIEYNSAKKHGFNMNKLSVYGNTEPTEKSVYFKLFVKTNSN
jgi:Protein of unknown function (DUF1573)